MEKEISIGQIGELTKRAGYKDFTRKGFQGVLEFPKEINDIGELIKTMLPEGDELGHVDKRKSQEWLQAMVRNMHILYANLDHLPETIHWGAYNVLRLYIKYLKDDIAAINKDGSLFNYNLPGLSEKEKNHYEFGPTYIFSEGLIEWQKGITLDYMGLELFNQIFNEGRNIRYVGTNKRELLKNYNQNPLKNAYIYYPSGKYQPNINNDYRRYNENYKFAHQMNNRFGSGGAAQAEARYATIWEYLYLYFALTAGRQRSLDRQDYVQTAEGYLVRIWNDIEIVHPESINSLIPGTKEKIISDHYKKNIDVCPVIIITSNK